MADRRGRLMANDNRAADTPLSTIQALDIPQQTSPATATVLKLIERVSPGRHLEPYGREEQPRTEWTVYGNQVERRLF